MLPPREDASIFHMTFSIFWFTHRTIAFDRPLKFPNLLAGSDLPVGPPGQLASQKGIHSGAGMRPLPVLRRPSIYGVILWGESLGHKPCGTAVSGSMVLWS